MKERIAKINYRLSKNCSSLDLKDVGSETLFLLRPHSPGSITCPYLPMAHPFQPLDGVDSNKWCMRHSKPHYNHFGSYTHLSLLCDWSVLIVTTVWPFIFHYIPKAFWYWKTWRIKYSMCVLNVGTQFWKSKDSWDKITWCISAWTDPGFLVKFCVLGLVLNC